MVPLWRRWSTQFVTKSTLANRDVHPAVVAWRSVPAEGQHGSAEVRVAVPRTGGAVSVSPKTRPAGVAHAGASRSATRAPGERALRHKHDAGRGADDRAWRARPQRVNV